MTASGTYRPHEIADPYMTSARRGGDDDRADQALRRATGAGDAATRCEREQRARRRARARARRGCVAMPETFSARAADEAALERASRTDPDNPFLTARYLRSQRMLGREGWLLSLEDAGAMHAAALCFLERGRFAARSRFHPRRRSP